MRTFEYDDGKSQKFWNIELSGDTFTVTYGKIGTKGQTQTKSFADAAKALKEHDKLVAEKIKKGYVETTPTPVPVATPLRQSMEDALLEHPDDLATHAAYADYLTEQGDPRGELIQTQLALEDLRLPDKERARLEKRQDELLQRHARQWLGDVGRFFVGDWSGPDKAYHYAFHRGWLDHIRMLPAPEAVLAALVRCPEVRLLRRLEIVYDTRYHPFDFDEVVAGPNAAIRADEPPANTDGYFMGEQVNVLTHLLDEPRLTNLRAFKLGFSDSDQQRPGHSTMVQPFGHYTTEQLIELLDKYPRLEELYLNDGFADVGRLFALPSLGNLRVLQYYYGSAYLQRNAQPAYPLTVLADNAALKRLTTLRFHPGRDATIELVEMEAILRSRNLPSLAHLQVHMTTFGDDGCRSVVASGILRRLKSLDLGYGAMTDEGARLLADCPDLKHLDVLDVTRNALTEDGIAALRATGVPVVADNQHEVGEDFLFEVDFE